MKKIIFTLILIISVSLISAYSYSLGLKNTSNEFPKQIDKSSLIGIWQASGGMASGWNDKYIFYSDGTFQFYPNEMVCKKEKVQLVGNWEMDKVLVLTVNTKITNTLSCDVNGFGHLVKQSVTDLQKPEELYIHLVGLGTLENDNYPSAIFDGVQYWQFSKDPAGYDDVKYSKK